MKTTWNISNSIYVGFITVADWPQRVWSLATECTYFPDGLGQCPPHELQMIRLRANYT